MKCVLCSKRAEPKSKLCSPCHQKRMLAASCARIWMGTGLTHSNVEAYSEENWIKINSKK